MALLPMDSPSTLYPAEQAGYSSVDTQESMFDEPAASVTEEGDYAEPDEAPLETFFEPDEVFADEIPELISYQSESGQPAVDPIGSTADPIAQSETAAVHGTGQAAHEPASSAAVSEAKPEPAESIAQAEPLTQPAASAPTMLTADDFAALEDRVMRAVTLVRSERQARIAAEDRVAAVEVQLHSLEAQIQQIEAQSPVMERLVQEVESLRTEREQVRQRVERLLGQLDALEL